MYFQNMVKLWVHLPLKFAYLKLLLLFVFGGSTCKVILVSIAVSIWVVWIINTQLCMHVALCNALCIEVQCYQLTMQLCCLVKTMKLNMTIVFQFWWLIVYLNTCYSCYSIVCWVVLVIAVCVLSLSTSLWWCWCMCMQC